ncbi:Glutathione S-transferase, N-terminal [Kalmanozyma brasiliensis GHG001]|uniref:Glutathione S-transferase, N-terminal n=1 Tax=Kalmanozyma brasiliensis (strain GHG001) TaxID=1365824 RepID=UPI001CEA17AB|nr:Glutathione S-transferase, N-terminal [Kalmanozyma brasiliensis GHG001]KAF6767599.1 Glutathione S-transferase, N-terminal [Kalmanozyma brasiliensis GHG001]
MPTDYPSVTFYDISCTSTSEPWSPYTARTYLALRVLGIPFERKLVPMARIVSTLDGLGVKRTGEGRHTLPAIAITSSTGEKQWFTDSTGIAEALQKLYLDHGGDLTTSLFPDAASRDVIKEYLPCVKRGMYSEERWKSIIPAVIHILEPESQEFFDRTRTEDWGKSPYEILKTDAKENEEREGGVAKLYANCMLPYAELYENKEKKQGVWLGGEQPVYADLMILALLQWYKCANTEAFEEGLKINGGTLQQAWHAGQRFFKES